MIIAVLSLLGISLLGSVGFIAVNLSKAPEGYEDEDGFHHARIAAPDNRNRQECDFVAKAVLNQH